jgi:hypothetical protein
MKKALVILDADLQAAGLVPGVHYEFLANVHDEWQIEVDEDKAEFVGKTAQAAIRKAGDYFGFRCPLDGEFKIGRNWAETLTRGKRDIALAWCAKRNAGQLGRDCRSTSRRTTSWSPTSARHWASRCTALSGARPKAPTHPRSTASNLTSATSGATCA